MNVLNDRATPEPRLSELRERAAAMLEATLGFIESNGNELSQCRARILVELEPVERGLSLLSSFQIDNGSFRTLGQVISAPYSDDLDRWDPDGAGAGTLEALCVMSDWKRLYESCADRAVEFLGSTQGTDGSWGPVETSSAKDAAMRVFATGSLAGLLGRTRSARPETLRAAGRYLSTQWSVENLRSWGWPAVAGFANYYTNVFDEDSEQALPWCARELERGKMVGDHTAVEVLRVLSWCEASALPGVTFDTDLLLSEVLNGQLEDGSVGRAESSAVARVASSLDAMSFVIRLCRGL